MQNCSIGEITQKILTGMMEEGPKLKWKPNEVKSWRDNFHDFGQKL